MTIALHCQLRASQSDMPLQCANILLDANFAALVSDFGLSQLPVVDCSRVGGTPCYLAPEVALGEVISNWEAIDSYCFGHIVYEVTHVNTSPDDPAALHDTAEATQRKEKLTATDVIGKRIREGFEVTIAEHVPPALAAIARACLSVNPAVRPAFAVLRKELEALGREPGTAKITIEEAAAAREVSVA